MAPRTPTTPRYRSAPRGGSLQPGSRRWRLVVVVVLAVFPILAMGSSLVTTRRVSEDAAREHALSDLDRFASTVADRIQDFLLPAERASFLVNHLIADGSIDDDDIAGLEAVFLAQLRTNDELAGLFVGRPDGSFVFTRRIDDGFTTKVIDVDPWRGREVELVERTADGAEVDRYLDRDDPFDPRNRPWYELAVGADDVVWTDPYLFFSSGAPGITAAMSIRDDAGELVGVVGTDVEIARLSSFLESARVGERTDSVLIDEAGVIVAMPGYRETLDDRRREDLPTIIELERPMLLALADSDVASTPTAVSTSRVDVDGETYLSTLRQIDPAGTDWTLAVSAPEADFTTTIDGRFRRTVVDLLAVSAAIVALAVAAGVGLSGSVQRLRRRAETDSLTGLLDRGEFLTRATRVLAEATSSQVIGVVMLDLDDFKRVNDGHGHAAGDEVLVEAAARLRGAVRDEDIVGRIGGDEFALLIRAADADELAGRAERVRRAVGTEPYVSMSGCHTVGATAGLAVARRDDIGLDAGRLVARADEALVRGKTVAKHSLHVAATAGSEAWNLPADLR